MSEDSIVAPVPQVVSGRVVEDTIMGHWAIKALTNYN